MRLSERLYGVVPTIGRPASSDALASQRACPLSILSDGRKPLSAGQRTEPANGEPERERRRARERTTGKRRGARSALARSPRPRAPLFAAKETEEAASSIGARARGQGARRAGGQESGFRCGDLDHALPRLAATGAQHSVEAHPQKPAEIVRREVRVRSDEAHALGGQDRVAHPTGSRLHPGPPPSPWEAAQAQSSDSSRVFVLDASGEQPGWQPTSVQWLVPRSLDPASRVNRPTKTLRRVVDK